MNTKMSNQAPRWNNHLAIGYMQDKIEDEDEVRARQKQQRRSGSGGGLAAMNTNKQQQQSGEGDDDDKAIVAGALVAKQKEDAADQQQQQQQQQSPAKNQQQQQQQQQQSSVRPQDNHPVYKILRRLPDYAYGDPLRKSDMVLCHSVEANAYAMSKLRPNDCAFILRSDGSFTYAIYEGYAEDNPGLLSFTVDGRGHFKVLPAKQFLTRVKVPVLPVQLIGTCMDRYSDFEEIEEEAGSGDDDDDDDDNRMGVSGDANAAAAASNDNGGGEIDKMKSPQANNVGRAMSRSTSVGRQMNAGSNQLKRRPSQGSLAQQQQLQQQQQPSSSSQPSPTSGQVDPKANVLMGMIASKQAQKASRVQDANGGVQQLPRSASLNQLGSRLGIPVRQQQQSNGNPNGNKLGNFLEDMIVEKQAEKEFRLQQQIASGGGGGSQAVGGISQGLMPRSANRAAPSLPRSTSVGQLRRQTVGSIPQQQQARLASIPANGQMQMNQQQQQQQQQIGSGNNIMSQMVTAPGVGVTAQQGAGAPGLGIRMASMQDFRQKMMNGLNTVPESSKLRMKAPNNTGNQAFGLRRNNVSVPAMSAAVNLNKGQANRMMNMPRNVTLMRISENEAGESFTSDASGNSANASWDFASNAAGGAQGNATMLENPLLKAASSGQRGAGLATSSENPLLKAMAAKAAAKKSLSETPLASSQAQQQTASVKRNNTLAKPKYSLGDRVPSQDMPKTTRDRIKMALSKLQVNDMAWVRRSDKSWAYALVKDKNAVDITFAVNANGDTKTFDLLNAWKFTRVVANEEEIGQVEQASDNGSAGDRTSGSDKSDGGENNYKARRPTIDMGGTQQQQPMRAERRGSDPPTAQDPELLRRLSYMAGGGSGNNMVGVAVANAMRRRRSENVLYGTGVANANSMGSNLSGGGSSTMAMRRRGSVNSMFSSRGDGMSVGTYGTTIRGSNGTVTTDMNLGNADWEDLDDNVLDGSHRSSTLPPPPQQAAVKEAAEVAEKVPPTADEKPSSSSPQPSSPPLPQATETKSTVEVPMVQCKTEDGGTKTVPMYKVGMDVYYKRSDDPLVSVRILQVHLDDLLEPYYYIRLEDGREKQTDNAHIEGVVC